MDTSHKILFYTNEIERLKNKQVQYPITCEVDLSNYCQLNCRYCISKDILNTGQLTDYPLFQRICQQLKECDVKSITITGGGEPLTNPQAGRMIKYAADEGFEVGLITNGVDLNKINASLLKFVRVSLDAATWRTYYKLKGLGTFEKVVDNIRVAVPHTCVGISYVVCKINQHEVEQAQQLANDLGVDYIQFKPSITEKVDHIDGDKTKSIYTNRYKPTSEMPCVIAGLVGIIGAGGDVYYCCLKRNDRPIGNIKNEPLSEIWKRRVYIVEEYEKCKRCRYMNYVKTYEEFNDPKYQFLKHRNFL